MASPALKTTSPARLKVLIVDDSLVARSVLARMVENGRRFEVAAAVGDVAAALQFLEGNRVDAILLDLEMPGIGGLAGLPDLIAAANGAKVMIVSSSAEEGAAVTIQALALGAADTLAKPGIGSFGGKFSEVLEERLLRLVAPAHETFFETTSNPKVKLGQFDLVAIGASTGGIHALSQLLRAIPVGLEQPILITQHLPASFMPYFAAQLSVLAGRPCEVARDFARIRPGRIIVAPGDAHLTVSSVNDAVVTRLIDGQQPSGCMPSVDPMFASVAEVYGARALAVVLSGMGKDGAVGAQAIAEAGGSVVVQDRASSVVWGMPGAVAATGIRAPNLSPQAIGELIASGKRPIC